MTYRFRVREHPLGVVVEANGHSELLIPDESCCGVPFSQLCELAKRHQAVVVDDSAAEDGPLLRRR